ncbi:MAG: flagellar hook-basal body complex protein FliE [Caulobacteraceae bacterium]|nr:flagellar hook-basal body complex protein FliE [Caulobacteraceae bacterium]
MVAPLIAARAYAAAQAQAASLAQAGNTGQTPDPHAFSEVLKNAMTDTMQSSRAAETAITNQVQGKGDLVDTVTAIASARASLDTVMAVRDQVISAYQQIMQMPI